MAEIAGTGTTLNTTLTATEVAFLTNQNSQATLFDRIAQNGLKPVQGKIFNMAHYGTNAIVAPQTEAGNLTTETANAENEVNYIQKFTSKWSVSNALTGANYQINVTPAGTADAQGRTPSVDALQLQAASLKLRNTVENAALNGTLGATDPYGTRGVLNSPTLNAVALGAVLPTRNHLSDLVSTCLAKGGGNFVIVANGVGMNFLEDLTLHNSTTAIGERDLSVSILNLTGAGAVPVLNSQWIADKTIAVISMNHMQLAYEPTADKPDFSAVLPLARTNTNIEQVLYSEFGIHYVTGKVHGSLSWTA